MAHRWGLGWRVGDRAAMGAATALALVALQTGAAFADAPAPRVPPDGTPGAFAALGCSAPAELARLARAPLPLVAGIASVIAAPDQGCGATTGRPLAPPARAVAAAGPPIAPPDHLAGGAIPAADAAGVAPRTPAPVPAASSALPGPALATTGTPITAALAGLVLVAVGSCLTWARARA